MKNQFFIQFHEQGSKELSGSCQNNANEEQGNHPGHHRRLGQPVIWFYRLHTNCSMILIKVRPGREVPGLTGIKTMVDRNHTHPDSLERSLYLTYIQGR